MKVILFDGHHLLFKFFFGIPPFIKSKNGDLIHGALGVISCIIRQSKKFDPAYPIVVFDSQNQKSKEIEFPFYKANRIKAFEPGSVNNPFSQLGTVLKSLDYMGIPYVMNPDWEADDVIGTFGDKLAKQGFEVIISSSDTDFLQLVTDAIFVFKENGKKEYLYNMQTIRNDWGIEQTQIVDYKALVGDNADNIKGVRGIGPKTARKLLNEYGTIENIFLNISLVPRTLAQKLNDSKEMLSINKQLIKINSSCEIDLPELKPLENVMELTTKKVFQQIGIW